MLLGRRQVRVGPKGPVLMLTVMVSAALFSIVTALVDVVVPVARGEEPFGVLFHLGRVLGPDYVFLHVFVHNFGLACLVPGLGFLAGTFEREKTNRRWIALILAGSVALSLATGIQYLFQAGFHRNAALLGLGLVEALAVALLAWPSVRHVARYVPTPAPGWSLLEPMRALRAPFLASGIVLALASVFEVAVLLG